MQPLTLPTRQRGLALVETAITLPFLLLVMLAASEFTNAFVTHTTLTKAVRGGARYVAEEAIDGSLTVNLTNDLRQETERMVVYGNTKGNGSPLIEGLTTDDITITALADNNIRVTANYPYSGILGSVLPTFGYGSNISLLFNMSATVTMRAL